MSSKETKVLLFNSAAGTTEPFEVNHAERLLRMPNNGGWRLPDDSPYIFDPNNGIGIKSDKRGNTKAKQVNNDNPGASASEQD